MSLGIKRISIVHMGRALSDASGQIFELYIGTSNDVALELPEHVVGMLNKIKRHHVHPRLSKECVCDI